MINQTFSHQVNIDVGEEFEFLNNNNNNFPYNFSTFFIVHLNQVVVNVDRDPSRLFKPTEGLKRRQEDKEDLGNRAQLNTGTRALPHR